MPAGSAYAPRKRKLAPPHCARAPRAAAASATLPGLPAAVAAARCNTDCGTPTCQRTARTVAPLLPLALFRSGVSGVDSWCISFFVPAVTAW
jgi:hypothetical protein